MHKPIKKKFDNLEYIIPDGLDESIVCGNSVLIIGHEALLNKDNEMLKAYNGNVNEYIFDLYKEEVGINENNFEEHCHKPYINLQGVKRQLSEILNRYDKETDEEILQEVNPLIIKLIQTGYFKFILTTTIDSRLERAIKKILEQTGQNLRVMSIYSESNNNVDLTPSEVSLGYMNTTLYYMQGKATIFEKEKQAPYALIDDDYFDVIKRWIKNTDNISQYLKGRRILAIGCSFDDWLYRFFWYSLGCDLNIIRSGSNIVFLDSPGKNVYLKDFFSRVGASYYSDADKFLCNLLKTDDNGLLHLKNVENNYLKRTRQDNSVFISYFSGDYEIVKYFAEMLKQNGIDVWFDKKDLEPGDVYTKEIIEGINKSRIFIPVFSENVFQHDDKKFHYYRDVEWTQAEEIYDLRKNTDDVPKRVVLPSMRKVDEHHNIYVTEYSEYVVGNLKIIPVTICDKTINFIDESIIAKFKNIFSMHSESGINNTKTIISKIKGILGK